MTFRVGDFIRLNAKGRHLIRLVSGERAVERRARGIILNKCRPHLGDAYRIEWDALRTPEIVETKHLELSH